MANRLVAVFLLALIGIFQYQLWQGRGSRPDVARMEKQLAAQKAANLAAKNVNARLAAEVEDLKSGPEIIEEKARLEMGMVKPNEIYIEVIR